MRCVKPMFFVIGFCPVAVMIGCAFGPLDSSTRSTATRLESAAEERSPEATSLFGEPLLPPPLAPSVLAERERKLAEARARYESNPESEAEIIWLGRRLAYLARYREAIATYTRGLAIHPDSYRLLRHRGHRFLTLRRFAEARADLQQAARLIEGVPDEVEPDGLPNRMNLPRSTSHSNIYYHLGLAHYLSGDFESARRSYERCMEFSQNDDMRVATVYWWYLTLRRLERHADATALLSLIHERMDVIENHAYHNLLLLFKGHRTVDTMVSEDEEDTIADATLGYGVGAWYVLEGEEGRGLQVFRRLVSGPAWQAFGYIAAEAELKRRADAGES